MGEHLGRSIQAWQSLLPKQGPSCWWDQPSLMSYQRCWSTAFRSLHLLCAHMQSLNSNLAQWCRKCAWQMFCKESKLPRRSLHKRRDCYRENQLRGTSHMASSELPRTTLKTLWGWQPYYRNHRSFGLRFYRNCCRLRCDCVLQSSRLLSPAG